MKATNYLVTYTDLSTMGFTAKGTPATGNRIATKQFVIDNYFVDESASPFSTYTSLRCPPYQTIINAPYTISWFFTNNGGGSITIYVDGFSVANSSTVGNTSGSFRVSASNTVRTVVFDSFAGGAGDSAYVALVYGSGGTYTDCNTANVTIDNSRTFSSNDTISMTADNTGGPC